MGSVHTDSLLQWILEQMNDWLQDILVMLIISSLWAYTIWYLSHGEIREDDEDNEE